MDKLLFLLDDYRTSHSSMKTSMRASNQAAVLPCDFIRLVSRLAPPVKVVHIQETPSNPLFTMIYCFVSET